MYGHKVRTAYDIRRVSRDVVGRVDTSAAGNLILEIGEMEIEGTTWQKTGHVVLTPEEYLEFRAECDRNMGVPHV